MILTAVQHERAPRNTSSLVAAARRGPSVLYPGIPHVYHAASNPYHPLLYPALFPFKPAMSAFTPSVGKRNNLLYCKLILSYFIFKRKNVWEIISRCTISYYDIFLICSTFFATFTDRAVNSEHS